MKGYFQLFKGPGLCPRLTLPFTKAFVALRMAQCVIADYLPDGMPASQQQPSFSRVLPLYPGPPFVQLTLLPVAYMLIALSKHEACVIGN